MSNRLPFIPAMGKDSDIQNALYSEGHLFFATDTGKIYLDNEGQRISMGGGGVSVLYANAEEIVENIFDGSYTIQVNDLEDEKAFPKETDLIINSDGRFFKVVYYDEGSGLIKANLIAVSGTGGGGTGGGGDSGGGTVETTIKLDLVSTAPNNITFVYGKGQNVQFKPWAKDDSKVTISYSITNSLNETKVFSYEVPSDVIHTFDLGSNLYLGQNTLIVRVIGTNSGSAQKEYRKIQCVKMELQEDPDFNPLRIYDNSVIDFKCIPIGQGLSGLKIDLFVDNILYKTTNVTSSGRSETIQIEKLNHGSHNIRAELYYGEGALKATAPPLEYNIACLDEEGKANNTPVIWTQVTPESIVNHDNLLVEYQVYNPLDPARAEVHFYINDEELITSPQVIAYDSSSWNLWNIINYKVGKNTFTISCGDVSHNFSIFVEEDTLRDLDIITSGLYLNLTTDGRSNKENPTSRENWSYVNNTVTPAITTKATFNNFNWYNNGWILDKATGKSFLRISNGASVEIPLRMFDSRSLTPVTFEIKFKIRNVKTYATLINFEAIIDESTGEVTEVVKTISSSDSIFCSYYKSGLGFNLGTQEAYFSTAGGKIVSGRYKDEDEVTVTFVLENRTTSRTTPLLYMYINGELTSIVTYPDTEDFYKQNDTLIFNSDFCDIDIYNIRVYTAALNATQVVHNYVADLKSAELYDMNQIVTFENNIPNLSYLDLIEYNNNHPDALTIPYAVVQLTNPSDEKELLPYVKEDGGERQVNISFVNPNLDKAYEDGEIDGATYLMGCPSFEATDVEMSVQGTSSQGYPRRNYKTKFKKAASWVYTNGPAKGGSLKDGVEYEGVTYKKYYMDNDHSEQTFTWKADYMESSMTHNTGFTSFVKTLYDKHPLQDYIEGFNPGKMRTTIYGFPMMVFQKFADGHYEFIGRYNFNLDKGANNVIGFELEQAHTVLTDTTFDKVAECWELKNNQGSRCSFNFDGAAFDAVDAEGNLELHNDFEYRYSAYEDEIDAAIDSKDNAYLLEKFKNLQDVSEWLYATNINRTESLSSLTFPVTYGEVTYTEDNTEFRLAKFKNEFQDHFDLHYSIIYFICTELLVQYDSRGKNMMLATWGPQKTGGNYIWYPIFYDVDTQLGINNSGVPMWDYDVEPTVQNQFSTNQSPLHNNLWTCFSDQIKNTYRTLRSRETNGLNYRNLNGYYSYDPDVSGSYAMRGVKPVTLINVDQYWKYIAPTYSGYVNTGGTISYDEGRRFYCLQGSRDLQRELFLTNRFNYQDSEWLAGNHAYSGAIGKSEFRLNANARKITTQMGNTSDIYLDRVITAEEQAADSQLTQATWPQPLDANFTWEVTPFLKQYVTIFFDKTQTETIHSNAEKVTISAPSSIEDKVKTNLDLSQQLCYFGGAEYIASLGDISTKYPNLVSLSEFKRIRDIQLGSDEPGYYNGMLNSVSINGGAYTPEGEINDVAKTLLEKVNLTGLIALQGNFDISGSEKLKEFRALRTKLSGVSLAEGTQIEILHLPETVTTLKLIEPVALKGILTSSEKNTEGNFDKGLYIEKITNLSEIADDAVTSLNSFEIVGGNMGYDSYTLLDSLVKIKQKMQQNNNLESIYDKNVDIIAENVVWSPYVQVPYGEPYDSSNYTYFKKTDNYTFESYTDSSSWSQDTLNGTIYYLDAELNKKINTITSLDMLDLFIDSRDNGDNYFKNPDILTGASVPYLSGNIFVNNTTPISEIRIKNIYGAQNNFPELNIFVKNVETGYTAKFINEKEDGSVEVVELLKYDPLETIHPTMTTIVPTKLHHTFVGWEAEDGTILSTPDEFNNYTFNESNKVMTFIARFKIKVYEIEFYDKETNFFEITECEHGTTVKETSMMPYRDDSTLELKKRYSFKGWTDKEEKSGIIDASQLENVLVNVSNYTADKVYKFYAVFVEESVYDSITDLKYFNISELVDVLNPEDGEYYKGHILSIHSEYNEGNLKGKITLPVIYNGNPILTIRGFSEGYGKEITHVFFDNKNSNQLLRIGNGCFAGASKLQYVELPDSLKAIEGSGFTRCPKLMIDKFPSQLYSIGTTVFNQCFKENGLTEQNFQLPGHLRSIGGSAFSYLGIKTSELIIGGEGDPSQLTEVGSNVFAQSYDSHLPNLTIYGTAEREETLSNLANSIHSNSYNFVLTS